MTARQRKFCDISIHTTLAGGDMLCNAPKRPNTISIHTTLAGGDVEVLATSFNMTISIHTTLAGGDLLLGHVISGVMISIHTTLAGGDLPFGPDLAKNFQFQSTPPSRVATLTQEARKKQLKFQSTPPSRVATASCSLSDLDKIISIHTTLAGGDFCAMCLSTKITDFNPHHPRGWRLLTGRLVSKVYADFNPHHPRGWRPHGAHRQSKPVYYFNPHHPRGWRLVLSLCMLPSIPISIHTTLAGGDLDILPDGTLLRYFNPHHPRGWRPGWLQPEVEVKSFQSTPPSRVATKYFEVI